MSRWMEEEGNWRMVTNRVDFEWASHSRLCFHQISDETFYNTLGNVIFVDAIVNTSCADKRTINNEFGTV